MEISNYGDETIVFKKEEMMPGMTFNFFNCEKTKVVIEGKIKNSMLSRCKKVDISVEEVVSTLEIIKSEQIKVRVLKTCPTITAELCNQVQVFTTAESKNKIKVASTASQSVSIEFPREEGAYDPNDSEEDPTQTVVVPETWVSQIKGDKLDVIAQEGIE